MKTVILTVGPRGAGKSNFCNQIVQSHSEIVLVSRDAILIELFGSIYLFWRTLGRTGENMGDYS